MHGAPRDRDSRLLLAMYEALRDHHGPRNWWPGRTRLEIILGAILTQNTSWQNVVKALRALRAEGLLSLRGLGAISEAELARVIRPSGYYRQKARKIKVFLEALDRDHGGSLRRLASVDTAALRSWLLAIWGIGPETADSILLYAFRRSIFVVDAYTGRVLDRHGLLAAGHSYAAIQAFLSARIPANVALFNDFHAQLVWVGHHHCGTVARCDGCPLQGFLEESRVP